MALADGAIQTLTKRNGPDSAAVVSPDGKSIAYLGFEDKFLGYQNVELNVMGLDGSNSRSLTASLDRTIDDATWARGRPQPLRAVRRQGDTQGRARLAQRQASNRSPKGSAAARSIVRTPAASSPSRTTARSPSPAARRSSRRTSRSRAAASVRQLTHLNDGLLSGKTLGEVQAAEGHLVVRPARHRRVDRDAAELRSPARNIR